MRRKERIDNIAVGFKGIYIMKSDLPVGRSYGVEVSTLDSDQAQILPATPVRVRVRPLGYGTFLASL